jgi:hypothetical protein
MHLETLNYNDITIGLDAAKFNVQFTNKLSFFCDENISIIGWLLVYSFLK